MLFSRLRLSWRSVSAFARHLRPNAAAARILNDELVARHGITIEQYEILSRLAQAPGGQRRQADISNPPLVTAAHVQRELKNLEQGRLVARQGEGEALAFVLTNDGREKVLLARSAELDDLLGSGSFARPV